jgi:hypothetical protein
LAQVQEPGCAGNKAGRGGGLVERKGNGMTRAEVLDRYGFIDGPDLMVELIQEERVSIRAAGNSVATAIPPSAALELSEQLRQIGEEKLADRITREAKKARKYQGGK